MQEQLTRPEVEFIFSPVINFAMQQNHVPVIRKLALKNNSDRTWQNLSLEIKPEPDFAVTWTHKIESLQSNETIDLTAINVKVSAKYLSEQTERVAGTLTLKISEDEAVLYKESHDISILAFDQWNGIRMLPEILSAFVTPNHPEISKIIRRASDILQGWTGSPSFDEYQTQNPDRVKKQMAAIYEAIAERGVVYCSVPASFEESGQRIRMVDTICTQQLGNCLDLSLFYASCLEAVGIHPFVVIIKGHAFTGAWLVNDCFADSANDDVSLLTKRMADGINEIAVVEATFMNAGQRASFDDAVRTAAHHLAKEDDFLLFLDVKRSRFSGVRPLPLRVPTQNGWEIVEPVTVERAHLSPEEIVAGAKLNYAASINVSRQRLWERKLLDLSLRNNLLNLRITKTTVQLISVNLTGLEDALANGSEYGLLGKPMDWDNPLRNAGLYQSLNQSDPIMDLVKHEFAQKRLRTYLPENELTVSLTNLYRAAKLSLEENGANTLFIALGVLKWYETSVSEKPRYAPLLLVPIEIIKKSAQKGYVIRSREEETMMNITLLEMLRQDFGINIGGLETLPKDESGVDVKTVFNIIRQSIMSKKGWDVEEQAFIGTFSFSKFIMWNDIHNNADKLTKNKIVSSLIAGKIEWNVDDSMTSEHLDKALHPSQIALPISTDSSQLEAIQAAVNGHSFVLHGPPGTGKSQTITNIIANALYNGKKVLFVAEKMAALQVVQQRLEAIGLGAFCLELHSNKSKKSAVLEQLKRTSELTKKTAPASFLSEAERLHSLRSELNDYVEALHKVHHFGFSLYDAFTGYAQYIGQPDAVSFNGSAIVSLTKGGLVEWNDTVEELQAAGIVCGGPHLHPLEGIKLKAYTQQVKTEAREELKILTLTLNDLSAQSATFCSALKIAAPFTTAENFHSGKIIAELVLNLPDTPASMLSTDNLEQTMAALQSVTAIGKERDVLREGLLKGFQKTILSFDAEQSLANWKAASQQWFLPKWLKQRAIKGLISSSASSGKIETDEVVPLLENIITYQTTQEKLNAQASFASSLTGFLWKGGEADWKGLDNIADSLIKLSRQGLILFKDPIKLKEWRVALAQQWPEGSNAFKSINEKIIRDFITAFDAARTKEQKIKVLLSVDFDALVKEHSWVETLTQCAQNWLSHIEGLRDWCNWNSTKEKAIIASLLSVVEVLEAGRVQSSEIVSTYKKGLYRSCAEYIFNDEPQLASFNGKLFEEKIKKFREVSVLFESLTKEELAARLAAKIPSFTQEASQSSEIAILQKAIRSNGRAMSIRKLFDSIPNLLPRMHPCMLMSPISVAQYFDAGATKFDLVVFDEASQMPTCEAIGALARAENAIIVGDPKQMPPTSFFSSTQIDEDNIEKEDLESILDDCLALSMPSRHLLWHYRSKHESLIAFSNANYYENKLLTFPSPDDIESKVNAVPVQGFYDRGKTKQNTAEAKAIVEEIIYRLSDAELSKQSIGVVTFSSVQQVLIDDLLNEVWKGRPDLEAVANKSREPLFIKNLENVQGDERDVILFSVGYGPDKEGKVSLNFGPINRNGGWRRLNVAVSRARYEMKVFSTLKADQIDITRTASEGVAGLKAFLNYAEKGKSALQYGTRNSNAATSAFIDLMAAEIKKKGYEVHTAIGCSGYRIDIGVVSKSNPSEYILGILCDGPTYAAAKTARDREIVQTDVLRLLGWNIHRLWSTEWWEAGDKQIQGVIEAIKAAEAGRREPMPKPENLSVPTPIGETKIDDFVFNKIAPIIEASSVVAKAFTEYKVCQLEVVYSTSSEGFLQPSNRQKILGQIRQVVETEAPISRSLLCKRVLGAWGISRLGGRISAQFDALFPLLKLQQTGKDSKVIFWKEGQSPHEYIDFRIGTAEGTKREAEDLPAEEVANAVKYILQNQISLSKEELVREMAKLFGYGRIGSNVEIAMVNGINEAMARGYAVMQGERLVLKE
jgi:hypothetical protein